MRNFAVLALGIALASGAGAQAPAAAARCDKPVYLVFEPRSMEASQLAAMVLQREKVRATFLASAHRTAGGDSLDTHWAPWWKSRGAEGHAFVSQTRDEVQWLADERGVQPQFRVRPAEGAFAGRTFTWSAAQVCENISQAADRIGYITGVKPLPLFRPPEGRASPRLAAATKACGYQIVHAAPIGFLSKGAPSADGPSTPALKRALERVRPGDVVLAHLGAWWRTMPQAPAGLEPYIAGLKERGFCFQTLREHPDVQDWIKDHP